MVYDNEFPTGGFKKISELVQITVANFALTMATDDWQRLNPTEDESQEGLVYFSPSRQQLALQHFQSNTVSTVELDENKTIREITVKFAEKDREPEDGSVRKWHGLMAERYARMV